MDISIPLIELFHGIFFSLTGAFAIINKKKITNAVISSNIVFWKTLNMSKMNTGDNIVTIIMIPVIGFIFFILGVLQIYKSLIHFTG